MMDTLMKHVARVYEIASQKGLISRFRPPKSCEADVSLLERSKPKSTQ